MFLSRAFSMPSKQLDQEGIFLKKLRRLKNVRAGHLSTVSARRNEINELLSSEENVHLVTEKLLGFLAAVEMFKEAHLAYSLNLEDEVSVARCQEQFNPLSPKGFCIFEAIFWIHALHGLS